VPAWSSLARLAAAVATAAALACTLPGCIADEFSTIVGDDHTSPGGTFVTQFDTYPPVTLPAIGSGDPFTLTATSSTLVVSITCGPNPDGVTAKTTLTTAGGTVALNIATLGPTMLQVAANGTSCIGDTGLILLTTASNGDISGNFQANGHIASAPGTSCQVTGQLTSIPVSE
jgi:hypothetical protein